MSPRHVQTLGIVLATVATAFLPATAPPATAAPAAAPTAPARINDIDGDGKVDIVVAGTAKSDVYYQSDRILVRYGNGRVQTITGAQIGDQPSADGDTYFGARLVVGDLNRDGFADVVVTDGKTGGRMKISVWALWGGAEGLSPSRSTRLIKSITNEWGTQQTSRIAFIPLPEPVLAIGTDESRGGSLRLYPVKADGTLGTHRLLSLSTPGMPGYAKYASTWGHELSASGNLLVVGEGDYGKKRSGSGAVWVLNLLPGLKYTVTKVTQATPGIPGLAEEGDSFGSAVSVLGDRVVVSSRFEDVGDVWAAGAVTSFRVRLAAGVPQVYGGVSLTQDSPGVPGDVTQRNGFGAAVAAIELCDGVPGALVFVSRSERAEEDQAWGSVITVPFAEAEGCPGQVVGSDVHQDRDPLGVLRTDPAGAAGELPVTAQGDEHQLAVGWPEDRTMLTFDGLWIDTVAPPAA